MCLKDFMSFSYAWEKYNAAVRTLADSHASVQDRLCEAYAYQLKHLRSEQIPEELQNEFKVLQEELKTIQRPDKQLSAAAVNKAIGVEKATELAERIVSMYDKITQIYGVAKQQ